MKLLFNLVNQFDVKVTLITPRSGAFSGLCFCSLSCAYSHVLQQHVVGAEELPKVYTKAIDGLGET